MAQLGADVEALEATSNSMKSSADQIQTIASTLSNQLSAVWWQGDDHTRFMSEWESRHRKALLDAALAITAAADDARNHAQAQRTASS